MKKITFLLVLGLLLFQSNLMAQRNCYSYEYLQEQIQQDPQLLIRLQQVEEQTQRIINSGQLNSRAVVSIPVVVHVVYNQRSNSQNISEAQIISQIDVMNDDFRRNNADADNTWPQAADTEVEFCLATVDPNGNPTNGITRTSSKKRSFGTGNAVKSSSTGGKDAWPADQYLNIWVCAIGGGILGYAQFPGGNPATDGVVIDYNYFGTIGTATAPYDLGRTATHEVGHYLGLRHIWGDGNCNVDDGIADTPVAAAPNYTGLPCTDAPDSCPGGDRDMFENYMDYSDDGCMNMFTAGQSTLMQGILAGVRSSLANSSACGGTPPPAQEICDNGIDDDNDGLVDCDDPDCGSDPSCTVSGGCDAPVLIGSTPVGNTRKRSVKASLSWNSASGANNYTVQWRPAGSSTWSSTSTSGTSTTVSNLDNGTTYEWRVTSNCNGNQTATSGISTFVAGQASGARGKQNISQLPVYPNPAQNIVTIDLSRIFAQEDQILQLTDIMGRKLQEVRIDEETLSINLQVNDLPNGLYLIRISDQEGVINATSKLLIQH